MIYDASVLVEVSSNPDDRYEILKDFLSETRSDIEALSNAIGRGDFPSLIRLAHCIKGASSIVGAAELAAVCAQIEQAARHNVLPASTDLRKTFSRLEQYLGRPSGALDG